MEENPLIPKEAAEEIKIENNNPAPVFKNRKFLKWLTPGIILLFITTDLVLGYNYLQPSKPPLPAKEEPFRQAPTGLFPTNAPLPTKIYPPGSPTSTPTPTREKIKLDLPQPLWNDVPVKIPPPPVFLPVSVKNNFDGYQVFDISEPDCREIAIFPNGEKLIYCIIQQNGMGKFDIVTKFIKNPDQSYVFLPDDYSVRLEESDQILLPSIKTAIGKVELLIVPDNLENDSKVYKTSYPLARYKESLKNAFIISSTPYGTIYETRDKTEVITLESIYGRNLYLERKDHLLSPLELVSNFITDNQIPQITWKDGTKNNNSYSSYIKLMHQGCGGGGYSGTLAITDGSMYLFPKEETGITNYGDPVYRLTDPNNELLKAFYENSYKIHHSDPMPLSDFIKTNIHFLWKDKLNDWQVFIDNKYGYQGECAKPVIYLYPGKPANIKVEVGANIRQSDPPYQNGWQVFAKPDGTIIYNNKTYSSLFWDGIGKGIYPDTKGYGTLVAQQDLQKILKSQLKEQGLNEKESRDFLEFWTPHLPKTPFIRLTWLNTIDMNRLAPLSVSPKPETVIRVFLEFEGLEKPVTLIPQKFNSPSRAGFTLVEWGGLLQKP